MELKDLKGIGPKTIEALSKLNIITPNDLLYSFPKAYSIYEIDNSKYNSGENATIEGVLVTAPYFIKYRSNVNAIIFYIMINNEKLKCVYFGSDYLRYKLFKNAKIIIYGKYNPQTKEFICRKLFFESFCNKVEVEYKINGVKDFIIERAIKALFNNNPIIEETLPAELIMKYRLYPIKDYLYYSHFPRGSRDVHEVLRRRKYEEFFWYSMRLNVLKNERFREIKPKRVLDYTKIEKFVDSLDFKLTIDQAKALDIIKDDILGDYPMNRLIQGDVGCGKSIIALACALMEILAGYQVAIMVPTEILANQQYESAKKVFKGMGLAIELLTSSVKKKDADDILNRLAHNRVNLIIGTHSLIMDRVKFNRLGAVIIDEQHRFGVDQRRRLIEKLPLVDALYLTATPIPRSLGLTVFGDLDITSIKSMPDGRKPINTMIIDSNKINGLYKSIANHIKNKEQCYCVVPLVGENDTLNRIDINKAYDLFHEHIPSARIGIIHGKLKAVEKNDIMTRFKAHELDILISTTVIEVGVNVKNATMMIILNSECFGLAQLHQLRGRVGRSTQQGYCCLVSDDINNPRLQILAKDTDGFRIAEEDFRLRGPGDYLGNDQSGYQNLDYADFNTDINIWSCAKEDSNSYLPKFLAHLVESKIFNDIISKNGNEKRKSN